MSSPICPYVLSYMSIYIYIYVDTCGYMGIYVDIWVYI